MGAAPRVFDPEHAGRLQLATFRGHQNPRGTDTGHRPDSGPRPPLPQPRSDLLRYVPPNGAQRFKLFWRKKKKRSPQAAGTRVEVIQIQIQRSTNDHRPLLLNGKGDRLVNSADSGVTKEIRENKMHYVKFEALPWFWSGSVQETVGEAQNGFHSSIHL